MKAVREVMKENVFTINSEESIKKVAEIMSEKKIGCVVVTENNKPVGIITERDIVSKIVTKEKPVSTKAKEVMSSKLISIGPDDSVDEASRLMKKYGIKKLPVIFYGKLVGIITSTDIAIIEPQLLDEYRKLFIFKK